MANADLATALLGNERSFVRPDRRTFRQRSSGAAINLFYLPALALFALFTIYPFVSGIGLSFTNWDGYSVERDNVGLANYTRLFDDPTFAVVLRNTLVYGIGSTLFQQVLGLGLALALVRSTNSRKLVRTLVYLPALVSPVIMGTMYYLLFQYNNGAFNDVVGLFGRGPVAWISEANTAIAIIVAVNTLQFVGISMIIYLAGLGSIPITYYEASTIDGATTWQQFRHITVPLLQPAFATSIILNLIGGLKLFDVIQVLTGGGPGYSTNSVSTLIGKTYFNNQSAGYAATMGVFLFLLIMVISVVTNALLNRRRVDA